MAAIAYRPEIDGLRAVAVIPVILFHMGLRSVPGGFIGVDVFFVISGFLITSIMKSELEQGSFSFRNFWARRIRRILPAMLFVTAVTLAVSYVFVFWPEQQTIGRQALAALMSVANLYLWKSRGDYWGAAAEESPFLHMWSLSVEEQFYLLFPVVTWFIFRFRREALRGSILLAIVTSLGLFLWGLQDYPTAAFYLLPMRIWELGTGCLLALVVPEIRSEPSANPSFGAFATAGLGVVFASFIFIDRLNGGLALAVVGTALVLAFGQTGLCTTLLSQKCVVHIGKISYSLYLWHWPVLVLAKHINPEWSGTTHKTAFLAVIYILSLGTYYLIERPARRTTGMVPVVLAAGLVATASLWIAWTPRFYDTSLFAEVKYVSYTVSPNRIINPARMATTILEWPGYNADAYLQGGIRVGDESVAPEIVVLGDSHAVMWSDAIATIAKEEGISTAFYCMSGVSPFIEIPPTGKNAVYQLSKSQKLRFDEARLRDLERWKPRLVIIARYWMNAQDDSGSEFMEFLRRQNSRVLLIEDPPCPSCGERNMMQWLAAEGIKPADEGRHFVQYESLSPYEGGRQIIRELAARYEHVDFLPTYDLFAFDDGVLVLEGRSVLYLDNDHLSQAGAHRIIPRLREMILDIRRTPR